MDDDLVAVAVGTLDCVERFADVLVVKVDISTSEMYPVVSFYAAMTGWYCCVVNCAKLGTFDTIS